LGLNKINKSPKKYRLVDFRVLFGEAGGHWRGT
jgi:hypothetical protein